ncbi:unnamed protein product [Mucor hiemalis]
MAEGLKVDPAIERWASLRENTHLYFKWNKRNARRSLFWGIAVPVGLTVLSYGTDRKWNFAAAETSEI